MTKALAKPDVKSLVSDLCKDMKPYIMFRIAQQVLDLTDELTAKGRAPIKMSIGAPTVSPPQVLMDKIFEYMQEDRINTYSVPKGEPFFREAVARRMKSRFGVDVNPNGEVCSLIGSKEGLAAMFRGVISPRPNKIERDIILVPDPGYASYGDAIEIAGGQAFGMPLTKENNYLPDPEETLMALGNHGLNPNNVKALILNYPSNPIGATAPFEYYKKIVEFGIKHNILIISDVAYSEMVFPGEEKPHSILEVSGAKDIAVELHSMSKPYAITGWRLGFAVGNPDAIGVLQVVKSTMDSGIWKVLQKVGAFALESPECQDFIDKMIVVYQDNQKFMVDGFRELGWPEEALDVPKATFYFWVPMPPRFKSCEDYATQMLEKSGIVIVPGTAFGQHGEGYVRLSLVSPREELQEVLERMKTDGMGYNA